MTIQTVNALSFIKPMLPAAKRFIKPAVTVERRGYQHNTYWRNH